MKKWGNKVAWEDVCLPKSEGGLGIRKVQEWNKASMLRHIWTLCSKNHSLWAAWCKSNLLKGRCFWEVKAPTDCSWNWRKILKLRDEAIKISKYKVGNGKSISLWYSNWHPKGPLIPKYGPRIAYDAGIPRNAKVSKVISNMQWKWPFPSTRELRGTRELREIILDSQMDYSPNQDLDDEFLWMASKTKCYNAADTWDTIRLQAPKVHWHSLLWFPNHIPRHSFISWLAVKRKLTTKDKLVAWGLNMDPLCVLCGQSNESIDHLFFQCPLSTEVRHAILSKCNISKQVQPWSEEVNWAMGKFSGKAVHQRIRKLAWVAMIYHIWKERNSIIFKALTPSASKVINEIVYDVKVRCSHSFDKNISNVEVDFWNNWKTSR